MTVGYTITQIRRTIYGQVMVQIVTDDLKRRSIAMPAKRTSFPEIKSTIDWTLGNLDTRPVPRQ